MHRRGHEWINIHAQAYACTYACAYAYTYACTHAIHECVTCMLASMHARARTHVHAHTRKHTSTPFLSLPGSLEGTRDSKSPGCLQTSGPMGAEWALHRQGGLQVMLRACMHACARACAHACVRACVCVHGARACTLHEPAHLRRCSHLKVFRVQEDAPILVSCLF